jgi:hypothetical protein
MDLLQSLSVIFTEFTDLGCIPFLVSLILVFGSQMHALSQLWVTH